MSKLQPRQKSSSHLRSYASRYSAGVLLVCAKCERKLRRSDEHTHLAKLGKSLRKLARKADVDPVHIIPVSCLKLCPKGGVAVCTQADLRCHPPSLTLIRSREDIVTLFRESAFHPDTPSTL